MQIETVHKHISCSAWDIKSCCCVSIVEQSLKKECKSKIKSSCVMTRISHRQFVHMLTKRLAAHVDSNAVGEITQACLLSTGARIGEV